MLLPLHNLKLIKVKNKQKKHLQYRISIFGVYISTSQCNDKAKSLN